MTEEEFISRFDCRFPYNATSEAIDLIDRACAISPNAAFAIVYELVSIPRSVSVSKDLRRRLLAKVESSLDHPLTPLIASIARRAIDERPILAAEAMSAMQQVAQWPGQYSALAVVSMTAETCDALDVLYKQIMQEWQWRSSAP